MHLHDYRPQTKFAKVVFTGVCLSTLGGHAWFYLGGVHGFIWGACVVLFGGMHGFIRGGGDAWFYSGGHVWFYLGGVWFYLGGMRGFIWGACMVLFRGMHGFIPGGMHGFIPGGVHVFFSFFGYNEIQSMSGRYASYWNAFLLK